MHKRKGKLSAIDRSELVGEDPPSKHNKEERDDKVQRHVEELKEKNGQSTYTLTQYCI